MRATGPQVLRRRAVRGMTNPCYCHGIRISNRLLFPGMNLFGSVNLIVQSTSPAVLVPAKIWWLTDSSDWRFVQQWKRSSLTKEADSGIRDSIEYALLAGKRWRFLMQQRFCHRLERPPPASDAGFESGTWNGSRIDGCNFGQDLRTGLWIRQADMGQQSHPRVSCRFACSFDRHQRRWDGTDSECCTDWGLVVREGIVGRVHGGVARILPHVKNEIWSSILQERLLSSASEQDFRSLPIRFSGTESYAREQSDKNGALPARIL